MLWSNKIAINVDEINMASFDLLLTVNLYLDKTKFLCRDLTVVMRRLFIIIFLGNFF